MKINSLSLLTLFSLMALMGVITCMNTLRKELVIPGKTNALYSLEMAGNQQRVEAIMDVWKNRKEQAFALNRIDFALIFAYTAFLITGLLLLAYRQPRPYQKWLLTLLLLSLLACLLDVLEGMIIHQWLSGDIESLLPPFTTVIAIIKFLLAIPLLLLVSGGLLLAVFVPKKRAAI